MQSYLNNQTLKSVRIYTHVVLFFCGFSSNYLCTFKLFFFPSLLLEKNKNKKAKWRLKFFFHGEQTTTPWSYKLVKLVWDFDFNVDNVASVLCTFILLNLYPNFVTFGTEYTTVTRVQVYSNMIAWESSILWVDFLFSGFTETINSNSMPIAQVFKYLNSLQS